MNNVIIKNKHYAVDFEKQEVYNYNGGKLRDKKKINNIIEISKQMDSRRNKILERLRTK